jgi:inorganic pyrophosphatase
MRAGGTGAHLSLIGLQWRTQTEFRWYRLPDRSEIASWIIHSRDLIGTIIRVEIDRPVGSRHPEYGYVYPLNYGFARGHQSGDGEDLDVYVLGVAHPLKTFEGRCIAVIHRLNDDDDKLIVAPDCVEFSDDQIREATHFQERFFRSEIMRARVVG